MISIRLDVERALLRVRFLGILQASDFRRSVTPAFEELRVRCGGIRLLLLDVRRFDGWGGVGTFAEQIAFLRRYGRDVARIAVLGPDAWRGVLPAIGALFVVAEVRAFTPRDTVRLRQWLREIEAAQVPDCAAPSASRNCARAAFHDCGQTPSK